MRDVFALTARWIENGVPCALGTLVETFETAPASVGTTIAVDASGRITGNIGAGCYEGDIVQACAQTIADGEPRLLRINLTDTDEITGSTGCGGALKVVVWKPDAPFARTAREVASGSSDVPLEMPLGFRVVVAAKRRLVIVGATTLAQEIARMASALDYFVTVVDPRPLFLTAERIPDAGELVREWPDRYLPGALDAHTTLLVISHDPKFDIPALACALRSDAPYIGLLGSRRSQAARRATLREMGFDAAALERIHGPAGLDLGGASTGETALSILAHVVANANSRSGAPLETTNASIHDRPPALA